MAETIGGHIGEIPGVTLKVEQFDRIADARKKRANVVKRSEPKYS